MYTAAVITISDKGYRGERVDTSGPNLVEILKEKAAQVVYKLTYAADNAADPECLEHITEHIRARLAGVGILLVFVVCHFHALALQIKKVSVEPIPL